MCLWGEGAIKRRDRGGLEGGVGRGRGRRALFVRGLAQRVVGFGERGEHVAVELRVAVCEHCCDLVVLRRGEGTPCVCSEEGSQPWSAEASFGVERIGVLGAADAGRAREVFSATVNAKLCVGENSFLRWRTTVASRMDAMNTLCVCDNNSRERRRVHCGVGKELACEDREVYRN